MKFISKGDLILILKLVRNTKDDEMLTIKNMEYVFNRYGDDYFIEDGEFKLTTENEERKTILKNYESYSKTEGEATNE